LTIQSHKHSVEFVSAANGSHPFLSPVRSPHDAVVSMLVMERGVPDAVYLLKQYEDMVSAAIENPNVFVIPFTKITADVNSVLDTVVNKYQEMSKLDRVIIDEQVVMQDIKEKIIYPDHEWLYKGHIPRNRPKDYNKIVDKLDNLIPYQRRLPAMVDLYNRAISTYKE
jgi:hypothetical protein